MTRPLRHVCAFLILATALVACGALRSPAALIGGYEIGQDQLAFNVRLFQLLSDISQQQCGQPYEGESPGSACTRYTLSNLIQERLITEFANTHGVQVPEADVDQQLSGVRTQLGGEALDLLLANRELTEEDLRDLIRRLLLPSLVREAVARELATTGELRARYDERILDFTRLHLADIVVKTKREATLIGRGLTAGNFARNAEHFSRAPSAKGGGDLGWVAAGRLDPALAEAAASLAPGDVGGPLKAEDGWHLVLLVSEDVAEFEVVRDELLRELAPTVFERWFRERLAAADVEVNPRYGRFDPATAFVVPIRSTSTETPAPPSPAAAGAP